MGQNYLDILSVQESSSSSDPFDIVSYKMGHYFLDIQYNMNKPEVKTVKLYWIRTERVNIKMTLIKVPR